MHMESHFRYINSVISRGVECSVSESPCIHILMHQDLTDWMEHGSLICKFWLLRGERLLAL